MINLASKGTTLSTRQIAKEFRGDIRHFLSQSETVEIDLSSVELMTSAFSDELWSAGV
jgi:hypothetical protein